MLSVPENSARTQDIGLVHFWSGSHDFNQFPRVSIVIPTLNEAKNLPYVLPQIPDWVHEVIIVDGFSKDNTIVIAKALLPSVKIVMEQTTRGKGAALKAGFEAASGDVIVILDADGSMDPSELWLFVGALLAGADFVKGSRFIQGGGTADMSLFRMVGNWVLTIILRLLYGGRFSDLCYGYLAFWTKHADILRPTTSGFEVEHF